MSCELIDTHCHLDFPEFDTDRDLVIKNARSNGVNTIINIGSTLSGSRNSLELASRYDNIYAVLGIHPHDADTFEPGFIEELKEMARGKKVVAIGETGLDYYRNLSKPDKQKELFVSLIKLAKDLGLPLVIHCRQAEEDLLKILNEFKPLRAVIHCFSSSEFFLRECLDLGFFVSFTCNITYKKADTLRGIVKSAPLDRMMLETDAPYLPPEGLRGRRNEPAYVKDLAEGVSRIKQIGWEEVCSSTTTNAKGFFKIR